jgi:adenylate cyclase
MTRALQALASADIATMERLAAPAAAFRWIGTDPQEWWEGEDFLPVMRTQMEEMGEMTIDVLQLEGWEMDGVAWAATRVGVSASGSEIEMRLTAVFVLDAGLWRIVQWHSSEGVPNEDSLGFSLTTTLSEILDELDYGSDFAAVVGEGMLTLMFTDVEGSTAHARELGDRVFTDLMTGHVRLVADTAARHGGQLIKAVGDGTLVVFTSARAGVACAIEIQRATQASEVPYSVRIGVHAGDVVRTDADVMGFAVNKAARVAAAAGGGEIVVSSVVRELVGHDAAYAFGDSMLAELRGIDGIHELVPVVWHPVRAPEEVSDA